MINHILLTPEEIQLNFNRVMLAEELILQLPLGHKGRAEWLRDYGVGQAAIILRHNALIGWNPLTQSSFKNYDSRAEESSKDLLKQLSNVPLTPKP